MLDHHPEIAWALAREFAGVLFTDPGRWHPRLSHVELVRDFLEQKRMRGAKARVGATVHRYFGALPRLFPTARYVHIVRDPRDVSRSAIRVGFVGNVWRGAQWWADVERRWDAFCAEIPPARRHEVRYEQLIGQPEDILRGICDFIGVPYSPEMLRYPDDTNYLPADRTRIEPWRCEARATEIRIVEAVAGPHLVARGYPLSGLPALRIGPFGRLWWREHDRYRRVRVRIARNGLWLTAADFFARHARLHGYARRLRRRIADSEVQSLR
jgi:hypothetical protein